ncbi:MAG: CRISPR-associated endonuclease Cas2 [Bacteroidota bacterium]
MIYLIAYDISADRIRQKVARRLIAEGYERLQWSVFTGLKHPQQQGTLWTDLSHWLHPEPTARFVVIPIALSHFRRLQLIGPSDQLDIDYLTGQGHSLFF